MSDEVYTKPIVLDNGTGFTKNIFEIVVDKERIPRNGFKVCI